MDMIIYGDTAPMVSLFLFWKRGGREGARLDPCLVLHGAPRLLLVTATN
jgi:hypothetical protein